MAAATLFAGAAFSAEPETYALDPVHTRVMIAVEHAGFSKAIGTVSGSTGTLQFDPDDWTTARCERRFRWRGSDLGDAKWNQAVLANNLLDVDDIRPPPSFRPASNPSTRSTPLSTAT